MKYKNKQGDDMKVKELIKKLQQLKKLKVKIHQDRCQRNI